ncbi:MAG: hypothetical protein AAGC56_01060 [Pseudomonadota bacterium]
MKSSDALLAAFGAFAAFGFVAACGAVETDRAPASATASNAEGEAEEEVQMPAAADMLDAAITGDHRTAEEKARDAFRNPKETLTFFGVEPWMNVVEIWPGGGWYTNIIAPYLSKGGGVYQAAHFDPERSERTARAITAFEEKYGSNLDLYGDVAITVLGGEESDIAPDGSADVVVTFRNVHNWTASDYAESAFKQFYDALKPGGVLGVVEHRADGPDVSPRTGYVAEETVMALAAGAGFVFEEASEINANPNDTKDHPFGVWTLPPVRRSSANAGEPPAADFDRAAYDAIGESDRMTLRFRKPAAE